MTDDETFQVADDHVCVQFRRKDGSRHFVRGYIAGVWDGEVKVSTSVPMGAGPETVVVHSEALSDLDRVDMVPDDEDDSPDGERGGWRLTWGG